MKSSSIRLPEELRAALKHEALERYDRGEEEPSFGVLLLEAWRAYKGGNPPRPSTSELPGILTGLTPDDQFTMHRLADILRAKPPGPIFQALQTVLHLAGNEFVAWKGAAKPSEIKRRKS